MEMKLVASSSPHIRSPETVKGIMTDVLIALFPATLAGVIFFGYSALITIILGVLAAMVTEALVLKEKNIYGDGSAAVTGLLLALILPPAAPWWAVIFGSVAAILIGKHVFGGLGSNLFNPALVGRAILLASFAGAMTVWSNPIDLETAATPLAREGYSLMALFTGNVPGSIGETSALALILGAGWLFYRGLISWHIPATYIGSTFILGGALGGGNFFELGLFHVLAGGLLVAAFYMATDMVTSPVTAPGQLIFGVGCGVITVLVRIYGGYPEGVTFAILFMNGVTPLIDRFTIPRKFGEVKTSEAK